MRYSQKSQGTAFFSPSPQEECPQKGTCPPPVKQPTPSIMNLPHYHLRLSGSVPVSPSRAGELVPALPLWAVITILKGVPVHGAETRTEYGSGVPYSTKAHHNIAHRYLRGGVEIGAEVTIGKIQLQLGRGSTVGKKQEKNKKQRPPVGLWGNKSTNPWRAGQVLNPPDRNIVSFPINERMTVLSAQPPQVVNPPNSLVSFNQARSGIRAVPLR